MSHEIRRAKLDVLWMTVGTRKGTKYVHPVKGQRYLGTCECGWSTGVRRLLTDARAAMRAHCSGADRPEGGQT